MFSGQLCAGSGGATLALPLPPFAEQLGFNPSAAAAVGGGCCYARGGRFAHLWVLCLVSLYYLLYCREVRRVGGTCGRGCA